MLNLPNFITLIRLILTPFAVRAILVHDYNQAFWIGIAAGATDFLDGMAARAMHIITRSGAYFDPIADKVMLTASFVALGAVGLVPWWMVALVLARDLFILAMAGYGYFFTPVRDFPPSMWGKISTLLQILASLMVVDVQRGATMPVAATLWAMVAATIWSGFDYGMRGWHALRHLRAAGL